MQVIANCKPLTLLCLPLSIFLPNMALAQQPPSPPASAQLSDKQAEDETEEFTVVGQRLRRAGGVIGVNFLTGKMNCKVNQPSGDERIDEAACEVALRCAKQGRRNRDRNRDHFNACVDDGYDAFVRSYLAE